MRGALPLLRQAGKCRCRYSQMMLELQEVSAMPPPQFEVLCPRNPTSCMLFPAAPSSRVAPLVNDVVVVVEVAVACRRALAEGLRWWALLTNCVMGID